MLKINNVEYQYMQGHLMKKSLTGELFSRTFTIITNDEPTIKKYDFAEYNGEKYLVASINSVSVGNIFKTVITLVELTLLLEKYVLSPCSFTNINDTLKQQIEKLLYKVEPLRVGETPRFKLTTRLINLLGSKSGEDFKYTERMTLRDILDDMLSSLGVRCVVSELNNDLSEIYIDYLDLNYKSDNIVDLSSNINYSTNESVEYYANEFDISIQNVQSRKRRTLIEGWSTLKPVEGTLADSNSVRLVTNSPIDEIVRILVRCPVTIYYLENIGDLIEKSINLIMDCDVTNLFVESEVYDAMDITEQEKHIPYARGSNQIGVLAAYKKLFLSRTKLYGNAIERTGLIGGIFTAVEEWCTERGYYPSSDPDNGRYLPFEVEFNDFNIYEKILFQIEYVPILSLNYRQTKDYDNIQKKIASVYNQNDRNIDLDKFSLSIRSLANRTGNKEIVIDYDVASEEDILELGTRIDNNFSLVAVESVIFDKNIRNKYIFAQNYQADISVRLSRERRLFNTPIEGLVDRYFLIKDNLLLSTEVISMPNNSSLKTETLEAIVKSFIGNPNNDYIDTLLFTTKDKDMNVYPSSNKEFAYLFNGKSVGKSIVWQMKTKDNYSMGLSTGKRIWGGREVHLNPYVNNEGEFETILFRFIKNNLIGLNFSEQLSIGNEMPVIQVGSYPGYVSKIYSNQTTGYEYIVKKDRLEVIDFIYQLEAKALNNNIIVGNHLMDFISLLWRREIADLVIWVNYNDTYNLNEIDQCKGSIPPSYFDVQVSAGPNNYYVYTNYPVNLVESWAIGTIDGRLLIAVNNKKQPLNTIYFGLSRS